MSKLYKSSERLRLLVLITLLSAQCSLSFGQRSGIEVPSSICQGDTVNFSFEKGSESDASSFRWSFGDDATIIGSKYATTTQVVFGKSGSYSATMTTTNSKGQNTETSKSFTVNNCCDFSAIISASTDTICYGDFVYVTAANQGDEYYYDWNYGANEYAASTTGVGPHYVYFTASGSHTITLNVGKTCNCDNCEEQSDQVTIYVKPRPSLDVTVVILAKPAITETIKNGTICKINLQFHFRCTNTYSRISVNGKTIEADFVNVAITYNSKTMSNVFTVIFPSASLRL